MAERRGAKRAAESSAKRGAGAKKSASSRSAPKVKRPSAPKPAPPRKLAPALTVDLARARAHWQRVQGLSAPVGARPDEVLARTGWARTLGGVDVYLAVRARGAGLTARGLEGAVERSELQVVPAVRGCIYLVPRIHVPLVLRLAEEAQGARSMRELEKAGVSARELDEVAAAALEALRRAPCPADQLRKALPPGTVRSLGEVGKKLGISSPLPAALRKLELEGRVERTLEGGRLDSERYLWRPTRVSPFEGAAVPSDPAERLAELASIFFTHSGPATLPHFAEWAGISQKEARAAVDQSALVPVKVEGYAAEAWVLEAQLAALEEAEATMTVSFLAFEDNFLVLHGGPGLLADPAHHALPTPSVVGEPMSTLGAVKHLGARALVVGDKVSGFWELDLDKEEVVVGTFERPTNKLRRVLEAQTAQVRKLLVDDLGNAKSFALDTDAEVRKRAKWVRGLAAVLVT